MFSFLKSLRKEMPDLTFLLKRWRKKVNDAVSFLTIFGRKLCCITLLFKILGSKVYDVCVHFVANLQRVVSCRLLDGENLKSTVRGKVLHNKHIPKQSD
jgi:hypothetical protein